MTVRDIATSQRQNARTTMGGIALIAKSTDKIAAVSANKNKRSSAKKAFDCSVMNARKVSVCISTKDTACPRLCYPDCKKARSPATCEKFTVPRDCKKILAPMPSFSECYRLAPAEVRLC